METEKFCYACLTNSNETTLINLNKSELENDETYYDKLKFVINNDLVS